MQFLIAYLIHDGKLVNFVASCSFPEKEGTVHPGNMSEMRPTEEVTSLFEGWDTEATSMLSVSLFGLESHFLSVFV